MSVIGRTVRRLSLMFAVTVAVSLCLADVCTVMLCVLSMGSEPKWFAPWARMAWPAAHVVAVLTVMVWELAVPDRWKS